MAGTRVLLTALEIGFPAGNRISRPPLGNGLTGQKIPKFLNFRENFEF
jgi:hypothetical protein